MNQQILLPISNLNKINKLLTQGWVFDYMVGTKLVLLRKYNNTRDSIQSEGATPTLRGGY